MATGQESIGFKALKSLLETAQQRPLDPVKTEKIKDRKPICEYFDKPGVHRQRFERWARIEYLVILSILPF